MSEVTSQTTPTTKGTAKIVYVLYLASIILGMTGIIGVIMAYINKDDAPDWLKSHYQFQIRTFWIGLLYLVIGVVLSVVVIGGLIILFYLIWLIVRSVKGLKALDQEKPVDDPTSWLF